MCKDHTIEPFSGFLFRIPHFPFNRLKESLLNNTFGRQLAACLLKDKVFMEAIFLASPVFYKECIKYNPDDPKPGRNKRIVEVLLQYYIRMCSRSTPFGLFAGISTGIWGTESRIEVSGFKYSIQPDSEIIDQTLNNSCTCKKELKSMVFYANSTIYPVGEQYRYYARSEFGDHYKLMRINNDGLAKLLIEESEPGISFEKLSEKFREFGLGPKKSKKLIKTALKEQLIFSGSGYNVCEELPDKKISSFSQSGLSPGVNLNMLKEKCRNIGTDNTAYYTNLNIITSSSTIDKKVIDSLKHGIQILLRLKEEYGVSNYLNEFISKFQDKYDREEILLLEALDPDIGIQFNSEMLNTYEFPINKSEFVQSSHPVNLTIDDHIKYLIKLIDGSSRNSSLEIEIDEDDLETNIDYDKLPETFNVFFQILENGKVLIKSISGPAANCLINRFNIFSPAVNELAREISNHDIKAYDSLLTEVEYKPSGRTANVLRRKIHYPYKTSLFLDKSYRNTCRLPLNDLYLRLNNGKMILRSKKHNKDVIPCNSTAHNYTLSQNGIYRFLSELQEYYMGCSLHFSWNQLAGIFSFFPRIRSRNVILSPATWILRKHHFQNLIDHSDSSEIMVIALSWRNMYKIPSKILFAEQDNRLFIDLRNKTSLKLFISVIKTRERIMITEYLSTDSGLVHSSKGNHLHEIIAPFKKRVNV